MRVGGGLKIAIRKRGKRLKRERERKTILIEKAGRKLKNFTSHKTQGKSGLFNRLGPHSSKSHDPQVL